MAAPLTHRCRRTELAVEREEEAARAAGTAAAEKAAAETEEEVKAEAAEEEEAAVEKEEAATATEAMGAMEAAADRSLCSTHPPAPPLLTYFLHSTLSNQHTRTRTLGRRCLR